LEVVLKATCASTLRLVGLSGEVNEKPRTRTVTHRSNSYIVTDLKARGFRQYYNGFANRVLWTTLPLRLDLAEFSRRDLSVICGSRTFRG